LAHQPVARCPQRAAAWHERFLICKDGAQSSVGGAKLGRAVYRFATSPLPLPGRARHSVRATLTSKILNFGTFWLPLVPLSYLAPSKTDPKPAKSHLLGLKPGWSETLSNRLPLRNLPRKPENLKSMWHHPDPNQSKLRRSVAFRPSPPATCHSSLSLTVGKRARGL